MFSEVEQDAIALTRAMTLEVSVPEAITRRLQSALGDTELVELVGTVAAYNMVSRFLVALGITPEDSDHGR
jgi:alkylhydroperoxidase family enzyme